MVKNSQNWPKIPRMRLPSFHFKCLTWIELNSVTQSALRIIFGHCEAVPKIVRVQMCLKGLVQEAAEQRIQTLFWLNIRPRRLDRR